MKKKVRISVVDCGTRFDMADRVLEWISRQFEIELVARDAEYVLHSCFGYDVLNHSGVRLFVTGENVRPDFNLSDYAIGFDRLTFGDRYCRVPLYRFYARYDGLLRLPSPPAAAALAAKKGFCAYVASNWKADPQRIQVAKLLMAYKPVAMGGSLMNNVGGRVADKIAFQSEYKFAVAFENSATPGYVSEKIVDAFLSRAIPIYWGAPDVAQDFNPDAFVNVNDCGSLEAALARVREIDADDARYCRMLAAPWFRDGREPEHLREQVYLGFLTHIFAQPWEQAFRRNRGFWGDKYERRLREAFHLPHVQVARYLRAFSRHLRQGGRPYEWPPRDQPQ